MIQDLKYFDGSVQEIERIPQPIKDRYVTAFEMGYEWIIECASRRQKWIDMGQSLNLYLAEPSGKKLHTMYLMAWKKGLKTTYYLRSLSASRIEKSTVDVNRYGDPTRQTWKKGQEPAKAVAEPMDQVAAQTNRIAEQVSCSIEKGADCEACQ